MLPTPKNKVALVSMPWSSVRIPSLALAILKPYLEEAGFIVDVHLLNIQFATRLGMPVYEKMSAVIRPIGDLLFSQYLFGSQGLNEIANDWNILKTNPEASSLLNDLKELCGGSEELCERISTIEIPKFIDECLNQVKWSEYMAIGFTTTFGQSLASLALAKRIKDISPDVKVIFGGANVESEMGVEFIRGFPWVDYIVHGEGEQSLPELLTQIAGGGEGKRVPGVSMRQGGKVIAGDGDARPLANINESPMPDYSDYTLALQNSGLNKNTRLRLFFESSRGCWWGAKHHCTFCGLNTTTMTHRKKDADRVYKEIVYLSKKYNCMKIHSTDNILAMEYFKDLLPRLANEDIDIELFYEVKANLSKEQLRLMKEAGVKSIQPGIESINSRILKLMRKGTTAIQNIQLLKWCYEYDIWPIWNLMFDFPQESHEDYDDLPRIFQLMMHLPYPENIIHVIVQRFSPYFFEPEKFGLKLRPWPGYKFIFPELRVDHNKIAYFFEGHWDRETNPEKYIGPVRSVVKRWEILYPKQSVFCFYEKGPDYLLIHDNRPRELEGELKYRRFLLREPLASIYLFCDQFHSLKTICKKIKQEFSDHIEDDQIRIWLEQFVDQGLMFKEDNQYLSLAVRKKLKLGPI